MSLGSYLKEMRESRHLSLRDVERLSKERKIGAELSSGYLSMLERGEVKDPSPRILFALANVYEVDYIDLMKKAGYIPEDAKLKTPPARVAFRGAVQLTDEQKERVQQYIDLELRASLRSKGKRQG